MNEKYFDNAYDAVSTTLRIFNKLELVQDITGDICWTCGEYSIRNMTCVKCRIYLRELDEI